MIRSSPWIVDISGDLVRGGGGSSEDYRKVHCWHSYLLHSLSIYRESDD